MFKVLSFCAVGATSILISACGGGPNIPDGNASLPTYTESEELQDIQNLQSTENNLLNLGMKFEMEKHSEADSTTTVSLVTLDNSVTVRMTPDSSAPLANSNQELSESQLLGLRNYVDNARLFLLKYSASYNIKRHGQRRQVCNLDSDLKNEIEQKIRLCLLILAKSPNDTSIEMN